mmetsp:Transcript_1364/g.3255  ORF Transcript_1364/g.3255 Transcript_1364/m.3255 type:complete len:96 (+) Transcript_1364:2120-2407(+)
MPQRTVLLRHRQPSTALCSIKTHTRAVHNTKNRSLRWTSTSAHDGTTWTGSTGTIRDERGALLHCNNAHHPHSMRDEHHLRCVSHSFQWRRRQNI